MTFSHWMIGSYFWYNDRKWPYVILHRRINGHCLKWTFTLNQVSNWILLISLISSINIQLYHMTQSHDLTVLQFIYYDKQNCLELLVFQYWCLLAVRWREFWLMVSRSEKIAPCIHVHSSIRITLFVTYYIFHVAQQSSSPCFAQYILQCSILGFIYHVRLLFGH